MRAAVAILALMLAASCGEGVPGGQAFFAPSSTPASQPTDAEDSEAVAEATEAALEDTQGVAQEGEMADGAEVAAVPAKPARTPPGLFAALFGTKSQPAKAQPAVMQTGTQDTQSIVVQASLVQPKAARKRSAKSEISYGAVLPYGKVARICGLTKRQMGKKIAQYPERRPVHQLYDSDPESTDPRSFYLTGFADGCARQFTAALAVFGSVGMHEMLRYGLPAEVQPYSGTDKAYERLKRKVCGKPKRKPCGSKISLMEKDTVFLSVYERFEGNAQWMNLLLHKGDVVAQDNKKGGES